MYNSALHGKNQSWVYDGFWYGGSLCNNEFMLVATIHFFSVFFLARFFFKYKEFWSSFIFTLWFYVVEAILLTFISDLECTIYFDVLIYFFSSTLILFYVYWWSFFSD